MYISERAEQEILLLVQTLHELVFQDYPLTADEGCTVEHVTERLRCIFDARYLECAYGCDDDSV